MSNIFNRNPTAADICDVAMWRSWCEYHTQTQLSLSAALKHTSHSHGTFPICLIVFLNNQHDLVDWLTVPPLHMGFDEEKVETLAEVKVCTCTNVRRGRVEGKQSVGSSEECEPAKGILFRGTLHRNKEQELKRRKEDGMRGLGCVGQ